MCSIWHYTVLEIQSPEHRISCTAWSDPSWLSSPQKKLNGGYKRQIWYRGSTQEHMSHCFCLSAFCSFVSTAHQGLIPFHFLCLPLGPTSPVYMFTCKRCLFWSLILISRLQASTRQPQSEMLSSCKDLIRPHSEPPMKALFTKTIPCDGCWLFPLVENPFDFSFYFIYWWLCRFSGYKEGNTITVMKVCVLRAICCSRTNEASAQHWCQYPLL